MNILLIQFSCLPVLAAIGIITTYEDIKRGKIRNIWVISGLIYGFIFRIFTYSILNAHHNYTIFLTNFLLAIAVSFFLWRIDIWSAGDGKLFIAYSAILPLEMYRVSYLKFFPSLALLINIFVPPTIFVLIKSAASISKSYSFAPLIIRKGYIFVIHNKLSLVKKLFGVSVIFLFINLLRGMMGYLISPFIYDKKTIFIALLILYRSIARILQKNRLAAIFFITSVIIYLFLRLILWPNAVLPELLMAIKTGFLIMVLFGCLNKIVYLYVESSRVKTLPFAIWMFLGAVITWLTNMY